MAERAPAPWAAFWMADDNVDTLFTPTDRARIDELVRLVRTRPVSDRREPGLNTLLRDVEVLVSGWGAPRLDAAALDLMPRLRAVIHAAGTVKTFVDDEVFVRGIEVSSAAQANARPVAEFTLAAIIFGLKRLSRFTAQLRTPGTPFRSLDGMPSVGVNRPTIGIVGASRVGREVIKLLRVVDAEVLLFDPYVTPAEAIGLNARLTDLDRLCAASDVVSLHAPATVETSRMIGESQLAALRDGAVLINTARGSLVDTRALERHIVAGRIDAYLDVTDPEPLPQESPLRRLPNVVLTPHIAGALGSEISRLGRHCLDELRRFLAGQPFEEPVRHADLVRIA